MFVCLLVYVHHTYAWCLRRPKGVVFPGTGSMCAYESPWHRCLGPREEQGGKHSLLLNLSSPYSLGLERWLGKWLFQRTWVHPSTHTPQSHQLQCPRPSCTPLHWGSSPGPALASMRLRADTYAPHTKNNKIVKIWYIGILCIYILFLGTWSCRVALGRQILVTKPRLASDSEQSQVGTINFEESLSPVTVTVMYKTQDWKCWISVNVR